MGRGARRDSYCRVQIRAIINAVPKLRMRLVLLSRLRSNLGKGKCTALKNACTSEMASTETVLRKSVGALSEVLEDQNRASLTRNTRGAHFPLRRVESVQRVAFCIQWLEQSDRSAMLAEALEQTNEEHGCALTLCTLSARRE